MTFAVHEPTFLVDLTPLIGAPIDSRYHAYKDHVQKIMAENECVDYDPSYCRKRVVVSILNLLLQIFVPANTRWVMVERGKIYVSPDSSKPTLNNGFEDCHKGEWVDYKSFDAWQKNYIGTLKVNVGGFHLWEVD